MIATPSPPSELRRNRSALANPPSPSPTYAAMDDQALLALMLQASCRDPDRLAGDLLARFRSLGDLVSADQAEVERTSHGDAVWLHLRIVHELAVRLARVEAARRPAIASWTALQAYVRTAMAHRSREQFRVLYLDRRNHLMQDEWVAEGTVDHAPVYNSGPGRVARLGRVPRIPETEQYVSTVIECYLALTAGRDVRSSRACSRAEGRP